MLYQENPNNCVRGVLHGKKSFSPKKQKNKNKKNKKKCKKKKMSLFPCNMDFLDKNDF